jgi:PhzF family phenazine biosynthesis protein
MPLPAPTPAKMSLQIVQVDAFTDRPFSGNPAAVCILTSQPQEWWLQDVAREMNLSETAFLIPHEDGYDLRWFAPDTEVDLCGHATLASAHVLWEEGHLKVDLPARFHTRSGVITAVRRDGWIEMDFPAQPAEEVEAPTGLDLALGARPVWVGRSNFDLLVELPDEKTIRTLRPNPAALAKLNARGVIVTSVATTSGVDFVSRFFAPRVGIPEDPVTGSAHCTLGPYWGKKLGKQELVGYQVSQRGGTVRVGLVGLPEGRVKLKGEAVTVLRGTLLA